MQVGDEVVIELFGHCNKVSLFHTTIVEARRNFGPPKYKVEGGVQWYGRDQLFRYSKLDIRTIALNSLFYIEPALELIKENLSTLMHASMKEQVYGKHNAIYYGLNEPSVILEPCIITAKGLSVYVEKVGWRVSWGFDGHYEDYLTYQLGCERFCKSVFETLSNEFWDRKI